MAVSPIPVDQRVIDIDSRRFASVEKALVELITNSDDSYGRQEECDIAVTGRILVHYERHQRGAMLSVADQAEGMRFEQIREILNYGGAHSPLSRGGRGGRGYFGRGLKQAIYGLGYGWIESIRDGRYTRIDLFRDEDGSYLYDDGNGDRPATIQDYDRLDIIDSGTRVAIVIDNPQVSISYYPSVLQSVANNVYLRDLLNRRAVELASVQRGKTVEHSGRIHFVEPPSELLLGPDEPGSFVFQQQAFPFTLTLKRALDTELTPRGDERTNGLLVQSDMAVLDCQLFEFENQLGTEYLFGKVSCPELIARLAQGTAIISDEREGLNLKDPLVQAFSAAVSSMLAPWVLAEQEKLRHLQHASTSGRTTRMISQLLQQMNRVAIHDMGIRLPHLRNGEPVQPQSDAMRFSTPFYYRRPGHEFHVTLLMDPAQFDADQQLDIRYTLPDSMTITPQTDGIALAELADKTSVSWTVTAAEAGAHAEILVECSGYLAWCEIVTAEQAPTHGRPSGHGQSHSHSRARIPRDHGEEMFIGYDFRDLGNDLDRAIYSPAERMILINTAAPTVQLYVDGHGRFRDAARLLLAELFMDVISDELARFAVNKSGQADDPRALHAAKLDVIRRYGSDIHLSFQSQS